MTVHEVEARRRELEAELAGLRGEVEQTIGWAPRAAWALPLVGLAAGFSLALRLGRGRKRRARPALPRPRR